MNLSDDPELERIRRDTLNRGLFTSLSKYAGEFIAEAWAEYLNNPMPRQRAREVGELIERRYRVFKEEEEQ